MATEKEIKTQIALLKIQIRDLEHKMYELQDTEHRKRIADQLRTKVKTKNGQEIEVCTTQLAPEWNWRYDYSDDCYETCTFPGDVQACCKGKDKRQAQHDRVCKEIAN